MSFIMMFLLSEILNNIYCDDFILFINYFAVQIVYTSQNTNFTRKIVNLLYSHIYMYKCTDVYWMAQELLQISLEFLYSSVKQHGATIFQAACLGRF